MLSPLSISFLEKSPSRLPRRELRGQADSAGSVLPAETWAAAQQACDSPFIICLEFKGGEGRAGPVAGGPDGL